MKLRAVGAALLLLGISGPAFATNKCSVKEYNTIGQAQTQPAQIALEPSIADNSLDFSGGAVTRTLNVNTSFVRIVCDTQAAYAVGTAPVATTANSFLPASLPEYFGVAPGTGMVISVVARP